MPFLSVALMAGKCSMYSIEQQFRQALHAAGFHYSGEIIADGKLHRFHIEGHKRSSKNGAYILHLNGYPAGWFMDYKTGFSRTWKSKGHINSRITQRMQAEIEKAKYERAEEQHKKHEATASKAVYLWRNSKLINQQSNHPYLVTKSIQPHGARFFGDVLILPMRDESKKIVNLQFIDPEGNKRFLSGGKKKSCFFPIGQPTPRILIVEGFATGASLHEETGQCVIVAFDAGNLLSVAKVIRAMFPSNEIIIAGDNDLSGIGQTKAKKAALAIGAKASIPPVTGMDWNDYLIGNNHNG